MDALRRFDADLNENATLVWLENGRPDLLLHGGSHFADALLLSCQAAIFCDALCCFARQPFC